MDGSLFKTCPPLFGFQKCYWILFLELHMVFDSSAPSSGVIYDLQVHKHLIRTWQPKQFQISSKGNKRRMIYLIKTCKEITSIQKLTPPNCLL